MGFPGGFCLHGDEISWNGFAEYLCGPQSNEIVIRTSWLAVGHVDEVVAVVPKRGQGPNGCNFSVLISSPRKAIDLLVTDGESQFLEYPSQKKSPLFQIKGFKNEQILDKIRTHANFNSINQLAQKELDQIRLILEDKILARFPQCKPEFIEVPALYRTKETDGSDMDSEAIALFPTLVNLVAIENTIISPNPHNKVFRSYMENIYQNLGLEVVFLDSYDYAFLALGDVHCATQTARICRPSTQ
jgi:protein-arginine deiminase